MPFTDSPRVIFQKNPLDEVICQLRFPPILRIEAEVPAAFQDQVRPAFPFYTRSAARGAVPETMALPADILQLLSGSGSGGVLHTFASSEDVDAWRLTLRQDFVALITPRYTTWADFSEKLTPPLQALASCYSPAFYTRVGLRYRDRIVRENLDLDGIGWHELLRPELLGELGDPAIRDHITHALRELHIKLSDDQGTVRVVHGLELDAQNRQTYIFDADFFTTSQTTSEEVNNVLRSFNARSGRLFRSYITQRLYTAMEPTA